MKVLIAGGGTGGHLMPALALADAIRSARPSVEPVLVAARRGVEATLLPTRPYRHHLLSAEPLYRGEWWRNLRWPMIAWRVLGEARAVLDREGPVLAVGTGGYAAGPMLFAAHRRGIPIALQEQNARPGLTTRWLARWAAQIHLGYPEAARDLRLGPRTRVFTHGNPIVPPPDDPEFRARARAELGLPDDAPVVLVTGGSQGARGINRAVADAVGRGLLKDVWLLWSTGPGAFDSLRHLDAPPRRRLRPFWDPISTAYGAADLVVARAGAMTTAELCAYGLPAVLIPLPSAAADHQSRNAQALVAAGAAVQLGETGLLGARLAAEIERLLHQPDRLSAMANAARARGHPGAARRIGADLLSLIPP